MKILIAMDSFKGNLSSLDVAAVVANGIRKVYPDAEIEKVAVADGGEGTIDAIASSRNGSYHKVATFGPLGEPVTAKYAVIDGDTAIIETAEASGLHLISKEDRNPLLTTTFGTGIIMREAINNGCQKIVLAVGGSATNDGGTGILKALGIKFKDSIGKDVPDGGGSLNLIRTIDDSDKLKSDITIISDVTNKLLGEKGASHVFSPQKGANPEMVKLLESNMEHYANMLSKFTGKNVADIPGTGAAGGIGAGLIAFFDAKIQKGIDFVLDIIGIEEKIKYADIVITGEGRMDKQTAYGKLPIGVSILAKKHSKPVFAIAGFLDEGYEAVYEHGIDAAFSSMVGPLSLNEAIEKSRDLIEKAAINIFRVIKATK
jgi:glycerate 2-kinase